MSRAMSIESLGLELERDLVGARTRVPNLKEDTRWQLARESSSRELLDILADDEYGSVRYRVSLNPNTSEETLERLSLDVEGKSALIALGLYQNPKTPSSVLESLYMRGIVPDNDLLFRNPNTPIWLLVKFWGEVTKPHNRREIEKNPNFPEDPAGWAIGLEEW